MYRSSFSKGVRAVIVSIAAAAAAQAIAEPRDQVIVTATRVEQPVDEIIGSVTVITREEIEQRQPQSVYELLRNETGLDFTNTGGMGKITTVFMRGAESEHTLVLIDGIRAGSITAGFTALEFLPVDQIERIEIVRGPRSSLYGSDAIGGVIQIFTRKGGDTASVRLGGGTHHTFIANGSLYGKFDNTSINVSVGKQSTLGFNACRGSAALGQGCYVDQFDRDGFSTHTGSFRVAHEASFGTVEMGATIAEGRSEYDGYHDVTEFRQLAPHIKVTVDATEKWRISLLAGATNDDQDYLRNGNFDTRYNSERRNVSLQSDLTLPFNQIVTFGGDFLDDNLDSTLSFERVSRDNGGVFALYQIGLGGHRITASARHDDNEQFGSHETGNVGWKWQIIPQLFVQAGWGTAFRAPSFNDLYHPFGANPDLLPERSKSYEVGVGGAFTRSWTWNLNAYRTIIKDMIDLDDFYIPQNIAEANIKGAELETSVAFGDTSISAGFSYVYPRNESPGVNDGKLLQRRAKRSGKLQIAQQLGPMRVSGVLRAQSSRFNDAANMRDREMGGYATVDVLAEYALNDGWQLETKLTNIFDKHYETVRWYNEPGFQILASVRYRLK